MLRRHAMTEMCMALMVMAVNWCVLYASYYCTIDIPADVCMGTRQALAAPRTSICGQLFLGQARLMMEDNRVGF